MEVFKMKSVAGKKVSLLIIMAVMILTVTGCGSKSNEEKQAASGSVQESQSTSESENQSSGDDEEQESQESDFDFSQAFDNVEVNGKKVPFPFTLNDLGEGFTVDSIVEMGDGVCGGTLYYKEEEIASVYMKINVSEDFGNDIKINELTLSTNSTPFIKINGIDCNSNKNDVQENFKEFNDKNSEMTKVEEVKGKNLLAISFNDDESIRSIYMKKGE